MIEDIKKQDPISPLNGKDSHAQPPAEAAAPAASSSTLLSKNIRIHKHRTSVRLEPEMWNALNEIATLEGCSIHDLCGAVHDLKDPGASFTAALRVFMMEYYRAAARANPQVQQVQKLITKDPMKSLEAAKKKLNGLS